MVEPIGKRRAEPEQLSPELLSPIVQLPQSTLRRSGQSLGDRALIDQALRDQTEGAYGSAAKSGSQVLAEKFAPKSHLPRPGCRDAETRPRVDFGAGSNVRRSEFDRLTRRFSTLEMKHGKLAAKLEKSAHAWDEAARQLVETEQDPVIRNQKVALARAAAAQVRRNLYEVNVEFGMVKHDYLVAVGLSKEMAIRPAKPGEAMLSIAELSSRTKRVESRIDTVANSGLVAPVAAFIYVVLTEASGRSLDQRDYRALDRIYGVGRLGQGLLEIRAARNALPRDESRAGEAQVQARQHERSLPVVRDR